MESKTLPLMTDAGEPITLDNPKAFIYPITVDNSVIDQQGRVSNQTYVLWISRSAVAHSAAVGYDWERYEQIGASFVVRRHEIDYLAPAFIGEKLVVATWPEDMHRYLAHRYYQLIRVTDGKTLGRAHTLFVYIDHKTQRPTRIPDEIIDAFR